MSAWQNPTDSCPRCGQDILLWPEVTPDVRMMYMRYCPRCDAGEPTGTPADRPEPMRLDADEIWGRSVRRERMVEEAPVRAADAGSTTVQAPAPVAAGQVGVDLWWDGEGGRKGVDARWARFAANGSGGEDDDEVPAPAEGTFSFNVEDSTPRRRRSLLPHRLRQSA